MKYSKPVVSSLMQVGATCRQGNLASGCMGGSRVDQDVKVEVQRSLEPDSRIYTRNRLQSEEAMSRDREFLPGTQSDALTFLESGKAVVV